MYVSGLIHRDRLFEIAMRWFHDRPEPDDGHFLTKIFVYESLICGPLGRDLMIDVLRRVGEDSLRLRRLYQKDEVRESILTGLPQSSDALRPHAERFRQAPQEYFPSTPVDLLLASRPGGEIVGMMRIKRIRRVAEKASRRVADRLSGAIEEAARALATVRARAAGKTLAELGSTADQMREDFAAAERIVSQAFRDRETLLRPADTRIDDVIGFKFVGVPSRLKRIEEILALHSSVTIVEREVHSGEYNATNLLLDVRLPPNEAIVQRMEHHNWSFSAGRGIPAETLRDGFAAYLESGQRTFRAEVILTTPEELIESEFGRSMHEEHMLDQRTSAPYRGRIASNASYLIEYMLMLAQSPTIQIHGLPVKMWGRYLPDTLSASIWQLFGVTHDVVVWDSFLPRQELLPWTGKPAAWEDGTESRDDKDDRPCT